MIARFLSWLTALRFPFTLDDGPEMQLFAMGFVAQLRAHPELREAYERYRAALAKYHEDVPDWPGIRPHD